jgi:hypothetical protein
MKRPFPDYAKFTIGPAADRTRWLHPDYTPKPVEALGFLS